jgi:hypothetical protein
MTYHHFSEGTLMRELLCNRRSSTAVVTAGMLLLTVPLLASGAEMPTVSLGAGMRTSLTHNEFSSPIAALNSAGTDFNLDSARIYLSGKVTDNISFMFNTEYDGEQIKPIDAVAQFSMGDKFNIWAGRFLAPTDRANLYGPYYASNWGVYQDGVQDGYAFITTGRSDGVAYWGQFGMVKVSAGIFDVPSTKGTTPASGNDAMYAARAQVDLWDPEGGYYLNGTYYGEKDLLAFGVATNVIGSDTSFSVDGLLEKKLAGAGVVTVEAEYAKYEGFSGGYPTPRLAGTAYKSSDGYYLLGAYLLPQQIGIGKLQFLAKVGKAKYNDFVTIPSTPDADQKTTELNVNYIIKAFNARISLFYLNSKYSSQVVTPAAQRLAPDYKACGLGLQIQM